MKTAIVSIIFTMVALAGAYFVAPKGEYRRMQILVYWAIATVGIFLLPYELLVLFVLGFILLFIGQGAPVTRIMIYLGCIMAVPSFYGEKIPFPGINYLLYFSHGSMVTLFLLGPLFLSKLTAPVGKQLRAVDGLLLCFTLLTGVMSIRDLPFTSMLRTTFDQLVLIYVPYIAISRSLTTQKEVDDVLKALFFACVICCGIGLISIVQHWNYYANLSPSAGYKEFTETRNGFLRIYSTLNTPLLALMMAVGAVTGVALKAKKALPALYFYGLTGGFALVAFATGSRGGWLGALLTGLTYFVLTKMKPGMRKLYLWGLSGGVFFIFYSLHQGGSIANDEYGTLNYRAELLRTSLAQIGQRPLFGSSDFLNSPQFEALRQGEGIIDLVNSYLQITLFYGLSGLILFLGAFIGSVRGALKALNDLPPLKTANEADALARRNISVLLAAMIGYLGMLATTSAMSYIWNIGYILVALLVAQVRVRATADNMAHVEASAAQEELAYEPQPEASSEAVPARVPYGARFVRRI